MKNQATNITSCEGCIYLGRPCYLDPCACCEAYSLYEAKARERYIISFPEEGTKEFNKICDAITLCIWGKDSAENLLDANSSHVNVKRITQVFDYIKENFSEGKK